jgi:hypothetical protein
MITCSKRSDGNRFKNEGKKWLNITRDLQVPLPCGPVDWGQVEFRLEHSPGFSLIVVSCFLTGRRFQALLYMTTGRYRRLVNSFFKKLFVHTAVDWIVIYLLIRGDYLRLRNNQLPSVYWTRHTNCVLLREFNLYIVCFCHFFMQCVKMDYLN